jgi:unspecific monooxygenase
MSTTVSQAAYYTPPRPEYPAQQLGLRDFLRAARTNALLIWPDAAYESDIFVTRGLGRTRMLINTPEAIHRVLVENPANYRRTPASLRILRPVAGNGVLLSEGESWRHQRRTIAPSMAPRVIPMLARHIAAVAEEVAISLRRRSHAPVNLLQEMQFAALEIAGRSMFSLEMGAFGPEMRDMLTGYGARLAQPHLLDILLPASIPAPRDFSRWRFQRRWMALIDRIIDARLALSGDNAPRDLFDLLRTARDPETGAAFTRKQLRDQVATMIVAGHETTAVTLFWSLYLLARAPDWQDAIAAETAGLNLGPAGAPDALPSLVQTRAVVSEALRLYPPAFLMMRIAIGPDRAGDLEIPRGAVLMIAPWVLHRHRRLWRDPDAFDPSRFLPDAPQQPRFAYLPFGAGPRICVGAQFAMAEATLVLAALVQTFRIALAENREVMPKPVVTTQPDRAPDFVLSARLTAQNAG